MTHRPSEGGWLGQPCNQPCARLLHRSAARRNRDLCTGPKCPTIGWYAGFLHHEAQIKLPCIWVVGPSGCRPIRRWHGGMMSAVSNTKSTCNLTRPLTQKLSSFTSGMFSCFACWVPRQLIAGKAFARASCISSSSDWSRVMRSWDQKYQDGWVGLEVPWWLFVTSLGRLARQVWAGGPHFRQMLQKLKFFLGFIAQFVLANIDYITPVVRPFLFTAPAQLGDLLLCRYRLYIYVYIYILCIYCIRICVCMCICACSHMCAVSI